MLQDSYTTIQSNNNARITSGKTSDHSSSPSSTQELSNVPLQSSQTKDSNGSKSGNTGSSEKNTVIAKIPETSPGTKERSIVQSKNERGKDKHKLKKTDIQKSTPDRSNRLSRGLKCCRAKQKNIQDLVTKKIRPRYRGEPDGDSSPEDTPRTKIRETKNTQSIMFPEQLQRHQKISKISTEDNKGKQEKRTDANSPKESPNGMIGTNTIRKSEISVKKPTQLIHRPDLTEITKDTHNKVETPKAKENDSLKKKLSQFKEKLKVSIKKSEPSVASPNMKGEHDNSILEVHHTKLVEASPSPGNEFDDAQVEKYYELLALYHENLDKIGELQRQIELQEKEMDGVFADTENELKKLTEPTDDVVKARKIHSNFNNEATKIRVHHKTNLITADLYTMENIFLQEQIAELRQEIHKAKAIKPLTHEEMRKKIQEIWEYHDDQRQRNDALKEQLETLKVDLNEHKCGGDEIATEPQIPDKSVRAYMQTGYDGELIQNEECFGGQLLIPNKVIRTDHSKSADAVSNMEWQDGPRETKSDHTYENRVRKVINSAKALLPDRRQNCKTFGSIREVATSKPAKPVGALLHKRCHKEAGETPTILHERHTLIPTEFGPFKAKTVLHRRIHQDERPSDRSDPMSAIHTTPPPACPRSDAGCSRKFRKTDHTRTPGC